MNDKDYSEGDRLVKKVDKYAMWLEGANTLADGNSLSLSSKRAAELESLLSGLAHWVSRAMGPPEDQAP